jgi:hypothetical protein
MKLNEWQNIVTEEAWKKDGVEMQVTWNAEGKAQAASCEHEGEFEFPDYDTRENLIAQGWVFDRKIKDRVVELMPNSTYFGVADEIIKLAPELKDKRKLIIGLIKQHVHCEKHSVYQRLYGYFKGHLPPHSQEILTLKMETHRDYARMKPEENHV